MSKPPRIICLVTTLGHGGTERNLVQYCKSIDKTKFSLEVWYLHETEDSLKAVLTDAGIRSVCLQAPGSFNPLYLLKIARKLKHSGADLIHVFLPTVGYYAVASRILFRSKIPMLYSSGGVQLLLPLQGAMMRYGLGRCCYPIVCNSTGVMDFWRSMNVDQRRLRVIHNGHDLKQIDAAGNRDEQRQQLGLAEDEPVIMTVGRLIESKRHTDLLQACASLRRKGKRFQLWIVGDGPCREALVEQTGKLDLNDQTKFLGTRKDIIDLMRAADLFAFPSESEGLPNAVIEAALCQLPIVAADIRPVTEIIEDGKSGTIFPVRNVDALAAGITSILEDPPRAARMATAARKEAAQKFNLKRTLCQLESAYQDALKGFRSVLATSKI